MRPDGQQAVSRRDWVDGQGILAQADSRTALSASDAVPRAEGGIPRIPGAPKDRRSMITSVCTRVSGRHWHQIRSFRRVVMIACLALVGLFPRSADALDEPLVADLTDHLIAITAGFTGARVVMFGSIEEAGDIVVVVRGPAGDVRVRRKDRIAGIWMNRESLVFKNAPAFFSIASSDPSLSRIPDVVRGRHEIGVDHVRLMPFEADTSEAEQASFRKALIRRKIVAGVWVPAVQPVTFLGPRLFRTTLSFPSNVPTGAYTVNVLLVRDNVVVSAQSTPLIISKTGVGAEVVTFAYRQAAIYGLIAIVLAVGAGWTAAVVFRR